MSDKSVHKCPVCDGSGKVSRPPWVPSDQTSWLTSHTNSYDCGSCQGRGIILVSKQGQN